jgi:S1-C subfamily serine protease
MISGHPALMPNVVTTGHFSGRKVIAVMKGLKPCTAEQANDPGTALLCMIVGGIPDVVQYDSTLVTATIMPGSSGSGVYNSDKELAGVAFAGSENFGFAWTVPYESMKNFIDFESKTLEAKRPDNSVDFTGADNSKKDTEEAMIEKLRSVCGGADRIKIKDTCRLVDQNMISFK